MAASAWIKFNKSIFYGLDGTIDYSDATAGAFKCALVLNTWTPATSADVWSDISANEVVAGFGYSSGGVALTNVALTNGAGVDKWDADDAIWNVVGGTLTARYAVIYHVATGKVIRYCALETGADKSAATGTQFVIQMSTSGIFTVT